MVMGTIVGPDACFVNDQVSNCAVLVSWEREKYAQSHGISSSWFTAGESSPVTCRMLYYILTDSMGAAQAAASREPSWTPTWNMDGTRNNDMCSRYLSESRGEVSRFSWFIPRINPSFRFSHLLQSIMLLLV